MTTEPDSIQSELDELNQTIAGLRKYLSGPALDAALKPLLEKQATLAAQLAGSQVTTAGSVQLGGERSAVGSSAGRDIITGDTHIQNQTIVQAADPEQAKLAGLKRTCLERLAHRCNILPLAALGGEESAKEEVSLADVYVNLDTKTRIPLTEAEKKERRSRGGPDERPLSTLEAATQTRRLALLGDPGSGKSTFVQQLAAHLALARLGEQDSLPGWPPQTWPLLTLLRDLAPRLAAITLADPVTKSQEEALVAAVLAQWQADLAQLDAAGLAADLPALLTTESVVLFFDGLDEVPEAKRRHVRLAVQAVLRTYPTIHRVIITCRIRSYAGPAVLPDFTGHTLAPFNPDQVRTFIQAWYNAQTRLGRLTAEQAADRTGDLQEAALSAHLQELAQNPMLLTTMALIHQREVGLPRERVRLYDEAVKVLLTRWQKRKDLPVSDRLQTVLADQLKIRQMMERLAYEVHQRQSHSQANTSAVQGDLPRLAAAALLEEARYLGDLGLASEFLDYVDQRAGLLQGRGGEEGSKAAIAYTFPHRTFQEYLAGCYMVTGRQRQVIQEYRQRVAEGDFWYLAGQLGAEELLYNRRDPEDMLDLAYALCPAGEPGTLAEWRAVVWSGQMAVTRGQAEIAADTGGREGGFKYLRRLVDRLKQALRLPDLKALERVEAGRALAVLGDNRPGVGLRPDGLPDILWCDIPAGPFVRGSQDDRLSFLGAKEAPRQMINLPAFKISRYPITNAQYITFVKGNGYGQARYWIVAEAAGYWREGQVKRITWTEEGPEDEWANRPYDFGPPFNLSNHPVVGVNWYEAVAFCQWSTEQLRSVGELGPDEEVTLPSESQWEKAARGPLLPLSLKERGPGGEVEPRLYPWGNESDPKRANYSDTGIGTTSAVGCFPQGTSVYGVEDMSGNVWEWCRTKYEESYKHYRDDNDLEDDTPRVLRGGSFATNSRNACCTTRGRDNPDHALRRNGFRVCVMRVSPSKTGSRK